MKNKEIIQSIFNDYKEKRKLYENLAISKIKIACKNESYNNLIKQIDSLKFKIAEYQACNKNITNIQMIFGDDLRIK